jgi:hypothetical protein
MHLKLSELEVEILRKLVNGEAVSISSQQRVRLELAGMIREKAAGITVTLAGRSFAGQKPEMVPVTDGVSDVKVARDRRGRRRPFQRRSVF